MWTATKEAYRRRAFPFGPLVPEEGHYAPSSKRNSVLVPDIQLGPPAADDPDLILSDDSSLPAKTPGETPDGPCGPWSGLYQVKISNANPFTESLLWLLCRDLRRNFSLWVWWSMMLEAVLEDDNFTKQLKSGFRGAWDGINGRRGNENRYLELAICPLNLIFSLLVC
ncbi:uncharacterized protein BDV17DRAFT_261664 [Aspergillus undulatus]|uniref:uncharacterized protein n=1 Tax=Aspergillus undulatus TaxID=1810928 RepID=UPI003CCD62F7